MSENTFVAGILDNGKEITKIHLSVESTGSQTQTAVHKAATDFQTDVLHPCFPGRAQVVELGRRHAARPVVRIPQVIFNQDIGLVRWKDLRMRAIVLNKHFRLREALK